MHEAFPISVGSHLICTQHWVNEVVIDYTKILKAAKPDAKI